MKKRLYSFIYYRLLGWKTNVTVPNYDKCVICAAPHTSNWDLFIGKLFYGAIGRKTSFMMKKEWFFFPLGLIFRAIGGFEGKLPVGKYKVLAFNSETANVETVDMDSYEKAAVIAKSVVTVRSGENMRLAEPGPVYAFRGEIEVVEGALSVYTVMADPLTQDIGMQVTNNTDLAIVSVRCDFPGIVLGRYLSRTRDKEPYHQESMGIYPAEAAFNNRIAEIGFRSFGVFSPAVSGLSETPIVLTLKLDDGRTIETEVAEFGKLLDEAVGDREFSAGLKLDIELKLAADGTGDIFVGIGIQGWKDYDGDGMPDKIGRNGKEILY